MSSKARRKKRASSAKTIFLSRRKSRGSYLNVKHTLKSPIDSPLRVSKRKRRPYSCRPVKKGKAETPEGKFIAKNLFFRKSSKPMIKRHSSPRDSKSRPVSAYLNELPSKLLKIQTKLDIYREFEEEMFAKHIDVEMSKTKDEGKEKRKKLGFLTSTDFLKVEVFLKRGQTIKGCFRIAGGRFPGRVRLDLKSKKFSFEVFFSSENFFSKKVDRTWIANKFEINTSKKISDFYFILRAQGKLEGTMVIDFTPDVNKRRRRDPFEAFKRSGKFEIAAESLRMKKYNDKTFVRRNKLLGAFKSSERLRKIQALAKNKREKTRENHERRLVYKKKRHFRKLVLANKTDIRNQVVS